MPSPYRFRRARRQARSRVSWTAILAATTLGGGQFASLRAQVSAPPAAVDADGMGGYRLIVQSYDSRSVPGGEFPGEHARPLASTQRAVTAEELERGVSVDVLHVGGDELRGVAPLVVAWVESGAPDLEFDALLARPAAGAVFGVSRTLRTTASSGARVVLARRFGVA